MASIRALTIASWIGRTRMLRIDYHHNVVHIPRNMFASERIFDELCQLLDAVIKTP